MTATAATAIATAVKADPPLKKGKEVEITIVQAMALLGVGRELVMRLIEGNYLPMRTSGTEKGRRYYIPLDKVLLLKGQIAAGTFNLKVLHKKKGGWKRPDLADRRKSEGIATLAKKVALIETQVAAICEKLGVTVTSPAPAAPAPATTNAEKDAFLGIF